MMVMTLTSCIADNSKWNHTSGYIWNTTYTIIYENKEDINIADSVFDIFGNIGKSLSLFDTTSVTARINRGEDIITDTYFNRVFESSKKIGSLTGGWFDPTVGPLCELWGFGLKHTDGVFNPPSTEDIANELKRVGIDSIEVIDNRISGNTNHAVFDFSAIAKGFGCDEVAEMFRRNNIDNFLVEIGGEIACSGRNRRNDGWVVQIDAPLPANNDSVKHSMLFKIKITDCGMATSGNYRNFKEINGVRYGHTIDPHSGYPVQSNVLSATVIAPLAMEADAFATAFMAMPVEEIEETIERAPGIEVMLVIDNNEAQQVNFGKGILKPYSTGVETTESRYHIVATERFPHPVK